MVPVVLLVVGCVFLVLAVAVYAYRSRAAVHVSGDSEEEEDDEDLAVQSKALAAETAALIDGEGDSLQLEPTRRRSVQADDRSLFGYLVSLWRPKETLKKKNKKPLMHRRNKGIKKIHKPYFYPLLDETAEWFAEWESKKQETNGPVSEVVEVRIDKPPQESTTLSPIDLLDGLERASLVSFRSNSHTILPVPAN
jgi:hypothetical protein